MVVNPEPIIVGAMKNVMWKGELGPSITLDTLTDREHSYGLGPLSYLRGEILLFEGRPYVSRVTSDSTMSVEVEADASAPFFVYARVDEWTEQGLPEDVVDIPSLEKYLTELGHSMPFVFRLNGTIEAAQIHAQNLPLNTEVSSPQEAHQGQTNYLLKRQSADILGFYSQNHQGVFTHHDSFIHLHLITKDREWMGHLDQLSIGQMKLLLPATTKTE